MSIGSNLQYLRRQKKITQEQLAERMGVSRQTVSRWESDEAIPELNKLVELCDLFACKLDALVRQQLDSPGDVYSPVRLRRVKGFTMARYVMISSNPEDDVQAYLRHWAVSSGLLAVAPQAVCIGWDFPFVSPEQQNRFHLRGYGAAYVLPEGFGTDRPGVEYARQEDADYAVITIREPFAAAFERIPGGYQRVMAYLQAGNFRDRPREGVLDCFEHVYERDGVSCMDVYVRADGADRADETVSFV